jgi:hypothetical protein
VGDLESNWARLLGHQPSDKDKQNLYRVRDVMNLQPTDAVWQLLIAFQYYEKLYEEFPARIAAAAGKVTEGVRAAAEAEAKAAHAETRRALTEAVRQAAVKSAQRAAGAAILKWVSATGAVICVSLLLVGVIAFSSGHDKGKAVGDNGAKKECAALVAASSWANTPDGQLAFSLAKVGGLGDVGRCSGRGMAPKDGWCVVQSDRGKSLARWRLPPGGAGP